MNRPVNPLVALLVIALGAGVVWYAYARVFDGRQVGYVGSPGTPGGAPINDVPGGPAPRDGPVGPPTRELYGLPPLPSHHGPAR